MKSWQFEKIFVINLPSRKGRLEQWAKSNFKEISAHPVTVIDGVDARRMDIETNVFSNRICTSQGHLGCLLSHIIALEMAVREDKPVLIMEDDAILAEDFVAKFERVVLHSDWDIAIIGDRDVNGSQAVGLWCYVVRPLVARRIRRWINEAHSNHIDLAIEEMEHSGFLKVLRVPGLAMHGGSRMPCDTTGNYGHQRNDMSHNEILEKQFSQYDEDQIIQQFFAGLWKDVPGKKGMFLEIGAMDGIQYSNCRRLALLGWSGVCVEPNPFLYGHLLRNYQGTRLISTVCACVGAHNELRTLHLNDDGLSTTDAAVFKSLKDRVGYYGHCISPTITPDDLVGLFGDTFDFVSVDAEGMDIGIVEASAKLLEKTSLLCVETDEPGQPRNEAYQANWKVVLEKVGFTKVVHQTHGNTLLTRP